MCELLPEYSSPIMSEFSRPICNPCRTSCCILSSHGRVLREPVRACIFSIVVSIVSSCLDVDVSKHLAIDRLNEHMSCKHALVQMSLCETAVSHVQASSGSNILPTLGETLPNYHHPIRIGVQSTSCAFMGVLGIWLGSR